MSKSRHSSGVVQTRMSGKLCMFTAKCASLGIARMSPEDVANA